MRIQARGAAATAALVLAVVACASERRDVPTTGGTASVSQAGAPAAASADALLDSARVAWMARDTTEASRLLDEAAALLRAQAGAAPVAARTPLRKAATALDSAARAAAHRTLASSMALDTVFARAQYAEARLRLERARDAWGAGERTRAGTELAGGLDELLAAAGRVGETLDARTTATLSSSRTMATRLADGATVDASAFTGTARELEATLRRIAGRIESGSS